MICFPNLIKLQGGKITLTSEVRLYFISIFGYSKHSKIPLSSVCSFGFVTFEINDLIAMTERESNIKFLTFRPFR